MQQLKTFDIGIRRRLENEYGQVWNSNEMEQEFTFLKFTNAGCHVQRKNDGLKGSLDYLPAPRFYFDFRAW